MLSVTGRVSIGYLGTEPNLYKVPVDNRFIDFKAKIQEMRTIEASIKDTGTIDMAMEDTPPIQPSIICLCRYTVYCLTTGGTVRWQIRLERVGTALMVYNTGSEF
ncbi:hypothetical protein OSTOST_09681 [Ostertagia ostertagi]